MATDLCEYPGCTLRWTLETTDGYWCDVHEPRTMEQADRAADRADARRHGD